MLDAEIKRWAAGKEGNLRALLSTLQYVCPRLVLTQSKDRNALKLGTSKGKMMYFFGTWSVGPLARMRLASSFTDRSHYGCGSEKGI